MSPRLWKKMNKVLFLPCPSIILSLFRVRFDHSPPYTHSPLLFIYPSPDLSSTFISLPARFLFIINMYRYLKEKSDTSNMDHSQVLVPMAIMPHEALCTHAKHDIHVRALRQAQHVMARNDRSKAWRLSTARISTVGAASLTTCEL